MAVPSRHWQTGFQADADIAATAQCTTNSSSIKPLTAPDPWPHVHVKCCLGTNVSEIYIAVRALSLQSRLVRLAEVASSFPLASHHGVLTDADALRRDLQTSSQIINMEECCSFQAGRVQI